MLLEPDCRIGEKLRMRSVRRLAVTGAVVATLMGTVGVGVASAQVKASAEQVGGIYFAGHASGATSKASGGFEARDYEGTTTGREYGFYYISGKVDCYSENLGAGTAVFSATITKGDLKGESITFWLSDPRTGKPDSFGYAVDVSGCPLTPQNVKLIEPDGYITIK